ncbi:MAG: hypothetical protein RLZZ385_2011 [Pseudomonadota bacterium]|jgi:uncharacterized protein (DUF934 family)
MPKLIKDRAIVDDHWTLVTEANNTAILVALPGRDLIVPYKLWRFHRQALDDHSGNIAVWFNVDEDVSALGADLHKMPLIGLNFPVFTDGRAYTSARELRENLGYQGEVRAIGDVLRDQMYYMHRCGINAFLPRHDQDLQDCLAAFDDFKNGYQASPDQPLPLFRRR